MIPSRRREFNARWTPAGYVRFLDLLERRCGAAPGFRNSETPLFLPRALAQRMADAGAEMLRFLARDPAYLAASAAAVPAAFRVPHEDAQPLFAQVDFGLIRDEHGELQPRLVEIQGFPSLYAYQPVLAGCYRDAYDLDPTLGCLLNGLTPAGYDTLLEQAIVGGHDPEQVVLLEIDPLHQKTRPDFLVTERRYGVATVDVADVRANGRQLTYPRDGRQVPIRRIYNRAIVDEMERTGAQAGFDWRADYDVEWAGHPNWYFRISKFSLPYLQHPFVPKTHFLSGLERAPTQLSDYVLKPLYSFAGLGVVVGPTAEQVAAVPLDQRDNWVLQERQEFAPVLDTPHGPTKAEIRIMYLWLGDEPRAVTNIVRTGRGSMMGVDQNRGLEWVGASVGLLA